MSPVIHALIWLSVVTIVLVTVMWTYRDAQRKTKSGWVWLLVALFTWPLGIYAYLLMRDGRFRLNT